MAKPCPNNVDLNPGLQQMNSRTVTPDVRRDAPFLTIGTEFDDLMRVALDDFVDSESSQSLAIWARENRSVR
jgi:hypothetical protein